MNDAESQDHYGTSPMDNAGAQSAFWPVLLIALSMIALLAYQFTMILAQRSALQTQIQQQSETVKRAALTQGELERVARELLALANAGDADAKAIVAKFKITQNTPASAPEAK